MSSGHREAIVRPSCTIRNNIVCKTASSSIFASPSGIIVSYSCIHRVSIVWPSVGFVYALGSILAFYQIRDENRAKLKISYSCGHRVSKSARYDATLSRRIHEAYRWPQDGHTMDTRIAHDYTRRTREGRGTGSFAYDVVANGTRRPHDGFTMA